MFTCLRSAQRVRHSHHQHQQHNHRHHVKVQCALSACVSVCPGLAEPTFILLSNEQMSISLVWRTRRYAMAAAVSILMACVLLSDPESLLWTVRPHIVNTFHRELVALCVRVPVCWV